MGNKLGWIIAGALVVVVALVIALQWGFPDHSKASATKGGDALDLKDIKDHGASIDQVMGQTPSGAGNAADDYATAISVTNSNLSSIDSLGEKEREKLQALWAESKRLTDAELAAFKKIDEAVGAGAAKAKMEYMFVKTPKEFKVGLIRDLPSKSFQQVADVLEALAADCKARKEYADAEKVLFHELVLGWHLMNERSRPWLTLKGVDIQGLAISGLDRVYHAQGQDVYKKKYPAMESYLGGLGYVQEAFGAKRAIVQVIHPKAKAERDGDPTLGDIYNIAENDQDRAWRIQALLMLGYCRFNVEERGDRDYIAEILKNASKRSDEMERAAAKAALDFQSEAIKTLSIDDVDN